MGIPFNPSEQATINQRQSELPNEIASTNQAITGQNQQIVIEQERDQVNKTAMDYLDDLVQAYELEKKHINGEFITSPFDRIVDIDEGSKRTIGTRFWPASNTTNDPTRFAEIDGGGVDPGIFSPHELEEFPKVQTEIEKLKNGFNDGTGTGVVFSPYTGGLTLEVELGSSITSGNRIVVGSALLLAGDTTVGATNDTIDILEEIVPGVASVSDPVDESFVGFTDPERTSETPTNPIHQSIFNKFAQDVLDALSAELVPIGEQKTALQSNPDDDSTPDAATRVSDAITNITNLETAINNFTTTPSYGDLGLAPVETELSNRQTFLTTRLSQIEEALKTATNNIYDRRFNFIALRINAVEGSIRKVLIAQEGLAGLQSKKGTLENTQSTYGGL